MQSDKTLFLATGNLGKLREARQILTRFQIQVRRVEAPKIEIQSSDLSEIASFAADQLSTKYRGVVAVEDSGLFIDSLRGFPGPFSSYSFRAIGPSGILRLLEQSRRRGASFKASIAVSKSGRTFRTFVGEVKGRIAESERGKNGFGFDPIFIPKGSLRTFGEMGNIEKNKQSHRQKAFRQLAIWFQGSSRRTQLLERAES